MSKTSTRSYKQGGKQASKQAINFIYYYTLAALVTLQAAATATTTFFIITSICIWSVCKIGNQV